jgi:excinuclease ABC subunit A
VIPHLTRRYRETDSPTVREELSKYLSQQPCPSCHGTRLNEAARHVFIEGYNLPPIDCITNWTSETFF